MATQVDWTKVVPTKVGQNVLAALKLLREAYEKSEHTPDARRLIVAAIVALDFGHIRED